MAEAIVLHQFYQVMLYFLLAYDLLELHGEAKISVSKFSYFSINKKGPQKRPARKK